MNKGSANGRRRLVLGPHLVLWPPCSLPLWCWIQRAVPPWYRHRRFRAEDQRVRLGTGGIHDTRLCPVRPTIGRITYPVIAETSSVRPRAICPFALTFLRFRALEEVMQLRRDLLARAMLKANPGDMLQGSTLVGRFDCTQ